jgi:membrane protein involved in colicin uptake
VQTGTNPGEPTRGSGTGSASATGSATQGEVGESGPDSNRVPPEYRDVVEEYFTTGSE